MRVRTGARVTVTVRVAHFNARDGGGGDGKGGDDGGCLPVVNATKASERSLYGLDCTKRIKNPSVTARATTS